MHPSYKTSIPGINPANRSGVALVIVLGFLTVLVIMGVAFVIVMRTERQASRAFADVVRARFIAESGLARALSDLDTAMRSSGAYPFFNTAPGLPGVLHCRANSTWPSESVDLLSDPEALRFSPVRLSATDRLVGWRQIRDPDTDRAIGRYTYLIVNSSGLLDINRAGGTNRSAGIDPREIQLSPNLLGEFATTLMTSNFFSARNTRWIRFDSLPDLIALGRNNAAVPADILNPAAVNATNPAITNLFVFSHAPAGWWDGTTIAQPAYVGSNFNPEAVRSAFAAITSAALAQELTNALIDYTDADFRPQSTASITVEPTPLINEIVIDQRFVNGTNICRPRVEIWYPFVGVTNPNDYTLVLGLRFEGADPSDYNPPIYTFSGTISGPWTEPRFVVTNLPFTLPAVSTNPLISLANFRARVAAAQLRQGVTPVDSVAGNALIDLSFADPPNSVVRSGGIAVEDPRLNHRAEHWRDVGASGNSSPAITMGAFNTGVANPAAGDGPAATNIFIANRPLRNTGELGMLFMGEPWKTIPLLGPQAWPVLHRFTVLTNKTHTGRVNINTPFRNVLATAFLSARAEAWPNAPNGTLLTEAQALGLADEIIPITSADPLLNTGELGGKFAAGRFTSFGALESEGILRNTADLLTPRQQIFTAFVAGEAYDASTNVTARRLLVAVIWRDPYPNENGVHDWFVRFFKWLGASD